MGRPAQFATVRKRRVDDAEEGEGESGGGRGRGGEGHGAGYAQFAAPDLAGGAGCVLAGQQEGTKLFETLVKQGEQLQDRTKQVATETAAAARGAATARAKEMQQMAGGTWDKLEQVLEDRVARALSKLGVYTQNDVQRLAARVDELAAAVNKLVKAPAERRRHQTGEEREQTEGRGPHRGEGPQARHPVATDQAVAGAPGTRAHLPAAGPSGQ